MISEEYYFEISKRFGAIKRARGTFFYTEKGIRLTDLYLENGRAVKSRKKEKGTNGTSA